MIVYLITNLINNKKYIGSSINNNPQYLGSGKWIKLAVKKYGSENFKKEILEHCDNIDALKIREEYWIDYYDAFNSFNFYNATKKYCGNSYTTKEHRQKISEANKNNKYNLGRKHSEITRKKIGESNKGKTVSEEVKDKIRQKQLKNIYALGNILSQETKNKISQAKTGHSCYNAQRNIKISQANTGKIRTEEHKLNYSKALKNKPRKKTKTDTLNLIDIEKKYLSMSVKTLSQYFNVSIPVMRRFLKNNNLTKAKITT